MGAHSSTQAATRTASATSKPAAATSAVTSPISSVPAISTAIPATSIISDSQISLISTQISPSTTTAPAITVLVTLTPSTVTVPTTESPLISTSDSSSITDATSSIPSIAPAALGGLGAGRLAGSPTGESSSLSLTMGSAASSPTALLSTAGIVVSGKKAVGPFAPEGAILGGIPTSGLDVPLTFVFLILFLGGAASHFSIHEFNSKRGHKFHLSDAVFDFCMVRTVTCTMRIVWAFRPNNISVVLAALIFENAGVVVLFAVNVIFTQRMIRALNPKLGWHPVFGKFIMAILISIPMIIVWNIVNLVVSFYTLNAHSLEVTRDLLLFGSSWTLFLSMFPILFIGFLSFSNPAGGKPENFGLGSFTSKLIILLSASALLFSGAVVRLIAAVQPHPKDAPGAIDSKLVFYITGFTFEIIVVYLYITSRIDLRFWVPNNSTQEGHYSRAKSGFALPTDDAEALFQEVDFKMRFSSSSNLPRRSGSKPYGAWEDDERPRLRQGSSHRWQDLAVDRTHATSEQVRQAISDLKLNSELMAKPVGVGNGEELLVYAFRCRQASFSSDRDEKRGSDVGVKMPRKIVPPRSESWAAKERKQTWERVREMI